MNPHHKKDFSNISTPYFPHIDLSDFYEVQKSIKSSRSPKTQKTIQSLKSPKSQTMCCRQIVEHKIQLIPPAKKGTVKVDKQIFTAIEKVCSEVVVILGFIRKTVTYTAVIHHKEEIPNHSIQDDVPFQCLIESPDIQEDHHFSIIEKKIIGEVSAHEANFGNSNDFRSYRQTLAFNFIEKDVIKVSIKMITK
ncbi:hypothetical protein D0U04_07185 [Bacillus clarus]|uniref:SipL SPOCS domain-containing protein n=1 Tax=Bacillus clarus TaxID=2338372 RepID=A0A090YKA2_9BACI|nr:hypothetical protein [Bacillus clarus]KFM98899.1 hypothetical protein DJ93_4774 [Bacillus clarus]RFT67680.1 hypothetical protein D0U04_07185 [Bacillus clarus]